MQQLKKQVEPAPREPSAVDLELQRIADEYDRRNRKGIYAEVTDPDAPDYFLDEDERRELYTEKEPKSFQERSQAAREEIYAKHSAPEEVDSSDAPPDPDEAMADFRAAHPEVSDSDWAIINSPAFYTKAPDVVELQQKLRGRYSRADLDAILARAEDHLEAHKTEQARRAAYRKAVEQRFRTRGM